MFSPTVNETILKRLAYNYRWATVPDGVIPLTAADSDMPVAPAITEAIAEFAKDGYFPYAPPEGHIFFREAIEKYYHEKYNGTLSAAHVFPTDSAAAAIEIACKSVLSPGDEAIILNPVDFLFKWNIEAIGGITKCWDIADNPDVPLDMDALEACYTPACKLLCLCNPINPNGRLFTKAELTQLLEWAAAHELYVLSDEIWADITYSGHSFFSVATLPAHLLQRTFVVSGFSKSFNIPGLRVGYIGAFNDALYQKAMDVSAHQSTVHGCNLIGQVAATAAMNDSREWQTAYVQHLEEVRNTMHAGINNCPGMKSYLPQATFVLWVDITDTGMSAEACQAFLLQEAKVAVVPGLPSFFGSGAVNHIRLSYSTTLPLAETAIQRIKNALEK